MKKKTKRIVLVCLAVVLILLVPVPIHNDYDVVSYNAVLYRVVVRRSVEYNTETIVTKLEELKYDTKTKVYFFPQNWTHKVSDDLEFPPRFFDGSSGN